MEKQLWQQYNLPSSNPLNEIEINNHIQMVENLRDTKTKNGYKVGPDKFTKSPAVYC